MIFFLLSRNTLNNRQTFLSVLKMAAIIYERDNCVNESRDRSLYSTKRETKERESRKEVEMGFSPRPTFEVAASKAGDISRSILKSSY